MKKSVKKNYIYNLAYQLLVIILPIITTPYLARTLGPSGTGTFSYTTSITTYFILFGSLGLSLYGQREIAYNQNNKEKRNKIFWELFIFRCITMMLSIIVFYFIFARTGEYALYYKILLLQLLSNCFDISWFFQGMEEFKKIVLRNLLVKIISIILIFSFIKTPNDVAIYILISVVSAFVGNLVLWLNINNHVNKVEIKQLNIKQHIKPTLVLFIPQIAIQIYTILDKTMIGTITKDMSEVGFYEQSQKIVKILMTIITSMGTVMLPRISNYFSEGKFDQIKEYMYKTFNFVFFLSFPMIFGIIAVSNNFVPFFFGEGYDKVKIILPITSVIILFIGLSGIIGNQYLLSSKRQKEFTTSVISGAVINFILNMILITYYKSIGACIATVIAEFTVTAIQFYYIRKDLNLNKIFKLSIKYFTSALVMFIIIEVIDLIVLNNVLSLFIQTIVGGIIYCIVLFILKDNFIKYIVNMFKSKIIKKA
ncbi:MAG: flippase [Bacilli bacterium]|nr:flippase [Bacilli bacterium]